MGMKIGPHETEIIGNWVVKNKRVVSDDACQRVEDLMRTYLIPIKPASDGWEHLYRAPDDGRYWERTFLQGEMQAGGPPTLRLIDAVAAAQKYGL
jgi:hypothetical protein